MYIEKDQYDFLINKNFDLVIKINIENRSSLEYYINHFCDKFISFTIFLLSSTMNYEMVFSCLTLIFLHYIGVSLQV